MVVPIPLPLNARHMPHALNAPNGLKAGIIGLNAQAMAKDPLLPNAQPTANEQNALAMIENHRQSVGLLLITVANALLMVKNLVPVNVQHTLHARNAQLTPLELKADIIGLNALATAIDPHRVGITSPKVGRSHLIDLPTNREPKAVAPRLKETLNQPLGMNGAILVTVAEIPKVAHS